MVPQVTSASLSWWLPGSTECLGWWEQEAEPNPCPSGHSPDKQLCRLLCLCLMSEWSGKCLGDVHASSKDPPVSGNREGGEDGQEGALNSPQLADLVSQALGEPWDSCSMTALCLYLPQKVL